MSKVVVVDAGPMLSVRLWGFPGLDARGERTSDLCNHMYFLSITATLNHTRV